MDESSSVPQARDLQRARTNSFDRPAELTFQDAVAVIVEIGRESNASDETMSIELGHERKRLPLSKVLSADMVCRWFESEMKEALGKGVLQDVKRQITERNVDFAIMNRLSKDDLRDLGIRNAVQRTKVKMGWEEHCIKIATGRQDDRRSHHRRVRSRSSTRDSVKKKRASKTGPGPVQEHDVMFGPSDIQEARAFLQRELSAWDAVMTQATLMFAATSTVLLGAMELDWHDDDLMHSCESLGLNVSQCSTNIFARASTWHVVERTLFIFAMLLTTFALCCSAWIVGSLTHYRWWVHRINRSSEQGPVDAAAQLNCWQRSVSHFAQGPLVNALGCLMVAVAILVGTKINLVLSPLVYPYSPEKRAQLGSVIASSLFVIVTALVRLYSPHHIAKPFIWESNNESFLIEERKRDLSLRNHLKKITDDHQAAPRWHQQQQHKQQQPTINPVTVSSVTTPSSRLIKDEGQITRLESSIGDTQHGSTKS